MKALFGRKPNYPDHHHPDFAHRYGTEASSQSAKISHLPEPRHSARHSGSQRQSSELKPSTTRVRSTLDALQMIRKRFEEAQKQQMENQAA